MSHFLPVALEHASRLLNHGPTILITSTDGTRRNVMAAAWSTPVEFTPPRIAVVIDKSTFTRELVISSGKFGICVPGAAAIDMTYAVGSISGKEGDKFERYGLASANGPVLGLPVIEEGCAAWLECRLIREQHTEEAYDTFFGEVVAAAADRRVFDNGHWLFDASNPGLHTIHHLGAGKFAPASSIVSAKPL
ncbi:flavin reductase family protein [Paraburkholderia sp.]|uniref:flavin reductase family protein n=1 Tax=Paraburkholderia sp. TaxID=1926495 RepID=UPI0023A52F19|nr:flavin reductase family protein [Paraburkholderia sp.]MDE1182345.1 flavin reductase family protein [Paraburkholderia sp.]